MKSSKNLPDVSIESDVPRSLQVAGAWAWRLLAVTAVLAVFIWLIMKLGVVVIPLFVAVLVAALLVPVSTWLQKHKWPKWLAVITSLIGLVVVVGGLLFLVVSEVRSALPDLQQRGQVAYEHFLQSSDALLGTTGEASGSLTQELAKLAESNSQLITSGLISVGSTAGHVLTGLVLAIFATIFFLIDGKGIWAWIVRLFPSRARPAVDGAGQSGWMTLTGFVKTQIMVAGVDAIGIGLGAFILGLPLALPIAVAVFLGSFIPVIGAIITGILAVVVALVFDGWVTAAIMLGIVLLVQQLESHILQPFLIGRAVKIHPLAIILSVAAGSLVAGIPGALFAVPIIAVLNTMVLYIARKQWLVQPKPTQKKKA